jgi:hypothetical protein
VLEILENIIVGILAVLYAMMKIAVASAIFFFVAVYIAQDYHVYSGKLDFDDGDSATVYFIESNDDK